MIVNKDTKICVGDTLIKEVYQGENKIYDNIPYTKLNYIESTGRQYINLNYYVKANTWFECQISPRSYYQTWNAIFGARTNQIGRGDDSFNLGFQARDGYFYSNVGYENPLTMYPTSLGQNYSIVINTTEAIINSIKCPINGFITVTGRYPILLFALNNGGGYAEHSCMRLYSFKVYEGDCLLYDLIPVLDNNNIPCLFDKVERKLYYNAGTGQFLYG